MRTMLFGLALGLLGCGDGSTTAPDANGISCSDSARCFVGYFAIESRTGEGAPFTPAGFGINGNDDGTLSGVECDALGTCGTASDQVLFTRIGAQDGTFTGEETVTEAHACATDATKGSCVTRYRRTTVTHAASIPGDQGVQLDLCTVDFPAAACDAPLPTQCAPATVDASSCVAATIVGRFTI